MQFDYNEAFSRNIGLLTPAEQEKIKKVRIAIAGMGGVGGVHLVTLLRMGFTKFTISDFDHFEVGNFNRQFGATMETLGRHKGEVMREIGLKINPEADIKLISEPLTPENVDEFIEGCEIYVDGMDVFEIEIRKHIFGKMRAKGGWSVTAGPIGFGAAYVVFSPTGMTFEEHCGLNTSKGGIEDFACFVTGLAPAALQMPYIDTKAVSFKYRKGPSNMLACQLCAGVAAAEVMKIVIGRGKVKASPYYHQFDAYRLKFKTGRLWFGGNGPWPRIKRWFIINLISKLDAQRDQKLMEQKS